MLPMVPEAVLSAAEGVLGEVELGSHTSSLDVPDGDQDHLALGSARA
jgi:hypothetical protein